MYLLIRVPLQAILIAWTWWFALRPEGKQPLRFSCEVKLEQSPAEIAGRILDVSNWSDFQGFAFLPGIEAAEFEVSQPEVVGSRIRVTNSDGSSHVEEIIEWDVPRRLQLVLQEFSTPLSHLAKQFYETWEFQADGRATHVVRSFEVHAKSQLGRLILWPISFLLKQAIARHLNQMRNS